MEGKNAYTLEGRLAKCVDTIAALVTATTTTFTARSEAVVMTGTKTTTVRPYASKTADTGRTAAAVELRTSAATIAMIKAAAVMDATSKEDAVTITVVINTMTDEGLTDEDLTAETTAEMNAEDSRQDDRRDSRRDSRQGRDDRRDRENHGRERETFAMTAEEEESGIERSPSPSVSPAGSYTSNSAIGSETVKADDDVYVGDAVDSAHQDMLQLNLEGEDMFK